MGQRYRTVLAGSACGTVALLLLSSSLLSAQSTQVLEGQYGKLPLSFEENRGQTDASVRFLSHGEGYSLFLTDSEAVLALRTGKRNAGKAEVVRMQLAGAKGRAFLSGMEELPGKANYFIGNDPAKWRSNVKTYGKVSYKDVYPGVDLAYYGNQGQLEYDFVIAPGADPRQVKLRLAGAMAVKINAAGDLTVSTKHGEIAFHRPVVYQWKYGKREAVEGRFRLLARSAVGFAVGRYDRGRQLVVDPTLTYSTYLGGSGAGPGDSANAIAVDAAGNAYVTGQAGSLDFPVTARAFQKVNETAVQGPNGYLSKLNPTGTALVYSTYFGGSGCCELGYGDVGNGVAIDAEGNAYVAGVTYSSDFPITASTFQTTKTSIGSNGFVAKFNATGSALVYSTYLGGSSGGKDFYQYGDQASAIAVDGSGSAYVTGVTYSTDFPVTPSAFQSVNKAAAGHNGNAFAAKLNPAATALLYSTYLGGSGNPTTAYQGGGNYGDAGQSIAVDSGGNAYVVGFAFSSDFPVTAGAFQTINKGEVGHPGSNAFVTKLNPLGTELVYSTFLGGGNTEGASFYDYIDAANSVALDSVGNAYVTGYAYSTDFPVTRGAFQTTNLAAGYGGNAFITKLNPDGAALVYSTYLGGTGSGLETPRWANGASIAVDAAGNAYVCGTTLSADFPVTADAFQTTIGPVGGPFLTEIDATGAALVYSSFLMGSGGHGRDYAYAIALDPNANAYLAGVAASNDFPVTAGAFQTTNKAYPRPNETTNAFITEFGIGSGPILPHSVTTLTADANPQDVGVKVTFTADVTPASGSGIPTGTVAFSVDGTLVDTVALDVTGHAKYSTSALSAGPHTILAAYSGDANYSGSSASLVETIIGTVPITFKTSPAGLAYSVDGTSYTSQQTLSLFVGSTHTISVSSPQTSGGVQNTFSKWSDGGAASHTIKASAATTYTANFSTAYLLTTAVNPTTGGTVSPGSGTYYPAGTVVSLTATANSGYAFSSWTGTVANAASASTIVTMNAPESVTASFGVSGVTYLFGNITGKRGASAARVWSLQVSNNGPAAAVGAEVSGITFTQVGGAACTPAVTTGLPILAGNLAPSANATVAATIDFASCAANARFTVNVALAANAGSSGGSIVRQNQFQ